MVVGGLMMDAGDGEKSVAPSEGGSTSRAPGTVVPNIPPTVLPAPLPTVNPDRASSDDELLVEERSVVMIRVFEGDVECWAASGVVFPTSEYIITNDHVVSADGECSPDGYEIWLTTDGSRSVRYGFDAELLASDVLSDVGILQVLGTRSSIDELIPLEEADDPNIGDEILLYGFPGIAGDSLTVSKGIVSGFINQDGSSWIKTDAAASGGSSGGPALTKGRGLVGVVSQAGSSSNGDIVDCRLVADTNNDGLIDEQDNCVPIGSEFTLLVPLEKVKLLLDNVLTKNT
jgi:S1-C subfamily serine protease